MVEGGVAGGLDVIADELEPRVMGAVILGGSADVSLDFDFSEAREPSFSLDDAKLIRDWGDFGADEVRLDF